MLPKSVPGSSPDQPLDTSSSDSPAKDEFTSTNQPGKGRQGGTVGSVSTGRDVPNDHSHRPIKKEQAAGDDFQHSDQESGENEEDEDDEDDEEDEGGEDEEEEDHDEEDEYEYYDEEEDEDDYKYNDEEEDEYEYDEEEDEYRYEGGDDLGAMSDLGEIRVLSDDNIEIKSEGEGSDGFNGPWTSDMDLNEGESDGYDGGDYGSPVTPSLKRRIRPIAQAPSLGQAKVDLPCLRYYVFNGKRLPSEASTLWPSSFLPYFVTEGDADGALIRECLTQRVRQSDAALAAQWHSCCEEVWKDTFESIVTRAQMSQCAEKQAYHVVKWHNHLCKVLNGCLSSRLGELTMEAFVEQAQQR